VIGGNPSSGGDTTSTLVLHSEGRVTDDTTPLQRNR